MSGPVLYTPGEHIRGTPRAGGPSHWRPSVKRVTVSPWMVTERQAEAMDAWISTGSQEAAAAKLGLKSRCSVERLIREARIAMGEPLLPIMIVRWDRWRRGEGQA